MIEKNYVILFIFCKRQGPVAVLRGIHLYQSLFYQSLKYGQIHQIVIHHQDLRIRCRKCFFILLMLHKMLSVGGGIIPQRARADHLLFKYEGKGGSLSVPAFYLQRRPHHIEKALCNAHTEAGSLHIPVTAFLDPFKFAEEPVHILFPDTDPRILHAYAQKYNILLFL